MTRRRLIVGVALVVLALAVAVGVYAYNESQPIEKRGSATEEFVTARFVDVPRCREAGAEPAIVCCGHPPPLMAHGGKVRVLEPTVASAPLNLAALIGDRYWVDVVAFAPGDRLLLYTDGVSETRNHDGQFFPLAEWMRQQDLEKPRELLDQLHGDLLQHSGGRLDDDIAALALRCADAPERGAVGVEG